MNGDRAIIGEAARLRAARRYAEAHRILAPLVSRAPRNAEARLLMAQILEDGGDPEASLVHFRAAAEASNGHPGAWRLMVEALLRAGLKGRARNAVAKAPLAAEHKRALAALIEKGATRRGPALGGVPAEAVAAVQDAVRNGRLPEARAAADKLLAEHPRLALLLNLRGAVAMAENDPAEAEPYLRAAVAADPAFAEAKANLGFVLTARRRPAEAVEVLRDALRIDRSLVSARLNLASALMEANRWTAAVAEAQAVLAARPDDTDALTIQATALMRGQRYTEALPILRRLRDLLGDRFGLAGMLVTATDHVEGAEAALAAAAPWIERSPDAARRAAMIKAMLGGIDVALDEFRDIIARHPTHAEAYRSYAHLTRMSADDPVLAKLIAIEAAREGLPRDRAALSYALGSALLGLKRHKEAFAAFDRANAAQRETVGPDALAQSLAFTGMPAIWTAERLAALRGAGVATVRPIFIVGMPRSGSTLLEQILAAHPDVAALGETSGAGEFFPVNMPAERNRIVDAARDGARIFRDASQGRRWVTDKLLANFRVIGPLAAAFPEARFVHTRRDPRAVALSIYQNRFRETTHPYATKLEWLAEYYVAYLRLMDHWRALVGERLVETDYETLVADPGPRTRAIVAALGLPWNDACLAPETVERRVDTLSLVQVREGISTRAAERWKEFAAELAPFTRVLEAEGLLPAAPS